TPRRTEPEVRRLTQALLWWNSLRFNEFAPIVERHLTLLFDLPLPPTYNVCIDSAVDSFPRIPFGRFRQIVASGAPGQGNKSCSGLWSVWGTCLFMPLPPQSSQTSWPHAAADRAGAQTNRP